VSAAGKIDQAIEIIREIGLPRQQQNTRSALTLLALLNLKPECKWKESKKPMIGITPMMGFFARHYGRQYAPNSRETVRRQTIHQFVRHGLVTVNPDRSLLHNTPRTVQNSSTRTKYLHRKSQRS